MKKVFLMGDIHGDWRYVRDFYNRHVCVTLNKLNRHNTLILLGDASLNYFFNYRDEKVKERLGKYPFTYFVIRGNHEQRPSVCMEEKPDEWQIETYFNGLVYVEKKYPYIKYASDEVSIYEIPIFHCRESDIEVQIPLKTLIVPGAYSVDKEIRLLRKWSWFHQEQLSEEEKKRGIELIELIDWKCDLVLSHTCPLTYEPRDLFLPFVEQSTVDRSMEKYLDKIESNLDYKVHLWGHFHQYREYPREKGIPCSTNPRQLMLFNDFAVDLQDVMLNENLVKRL